VLQKSLISHKFPVFSKFLRCWRFSGLSLCFLSFAVFRSILPTSGIDDPCRVFANADFCNTGYKYNTTSIYIGVYQLKITNVNIILIKRNIRS
jgi:hypothetical protein